ncbi:uncharacterized protein [Montipora foliosa]|uniref:uncharacterized protein isoform X2 n=1 Tax=Montipora foliosa TaxID=591990 RepID=UPI0035F15B24
MAEDKTGLAFSGGGIRSAALCSGVLRRLLRRGVKVDYISCVSGGNYTAATYLDWKYRHNNDDDHAWHQKFFEHMRKRAGYFCNWQRGFQGILDTMILLVVLIAINLVIPCVMYSSGAFTAAFIIDFVFGKILHGGSECGEMTNATTVNSSTSSKGCRQTCIKDELNDPGIRSASILFLLLFMIFIVCHVVKLLSTYRIRSFARILQIVSGLMFAFTFVPWLIQHFSDGLPFWLKISVFILSIFFWLGFPPLRRKASLAIVLYFYAFVIKWRVYQCTTFLLPEYSDQLFHWLLLISSGLLWLSPYLGIFSATSTFTYYKWRLQKAFFTQTSVGSHGCGGISCRQFFPVISCCRTEHDPAVHPLMMSDLKNVSPEYVSNVAVDYWRLNTSQSSAPSYAVMSMSPVENQRIDNQPEETMMAILIQSIVAFPIMFLAILALRDWKTKDEEFYAVVVFVAYSVVFLTIAIMPTGGNPAPWYDPFVRWCHVHMYHVRFLREVFQVNNVGPNPPAILSLSDGGRLEKYGLLYLLKRRLKKILIVDGSFISNDADYSKNILKSLDLAREQLHCEFVGFGGRDVKEQMRKEFVDVPPKKGKPRHFRFLVQYFKKEEDGSFSKNGTGEVMIITPRHPSEGERYPEGLAATWEEHGEDLKTKDWGPSPVLSTKEVDRLTFCCCECCHTNCGILSKISNKLCLGFPSTLTLNQFFTSSLFTAYHREGYRACVESAAEDFLTGRASNDNV